MFLVVCIYSFDCAFMWYAVLNSVFLLKQFSYIRITHLTTSLHTLFPI